MRSWATIPTRRRADVEHRGVDDLPRRALERREHWAACNGNGEGYKHLPRRALERHVHLERARVLADGAAEVAVARQLARRRAQPHARLALDAHL